MSRPLLLEGTQLRLELWLLSVKIWKETMNQKRLVGAFNSVSRGLPVAVASRLVGEREQVRTRWIHRFPFRLFVCVEKIFGSRETSTPCVPPLRFSGDCEERVETFWVAVVVIFLFCTDAEKE